MPHSFANAAMRPSPSMPNAGVPARYESVSACSRIDTVSRAEAKRRVSAAVSSGAAAASPPVSETSARQSGRSCRTFMAIYRSFQPRFTAISAAARAYSAGNGGAPRPRRGQTRRTFSRGAADTDVSAAPSAPRMSSGAFMPCFLAAARLSLSRKTIVSAHSFSAAVHLAQPRGESGPSPAPCRSVRQPLCFPFAAARDNRQAIGGTSRPAADSRRRRRARGRSSFFGGSPERSDNTNCQHQTGAPFPLAGARAP